MELCDDLQCLISLTPYDDGPTRDRDGDGTVEPVLPARSRGKQRGVIAVEGYGGAWQLIQHGVEEAEVVWRRNQLAAVVNDADREVMVLSGLGIGYLCQRVAE